MKNLAPALLLCALNAAALPGSFDGELAAKHGARILVEGTHYHLDFTPPNSPFYEETLRCDR